MSRKDIAFWIIILALLGLGTMLAKADVPASTYYCDYTKEKSEAERVLNQAPSVLIGFGRTNTGSNNVLAFGISESLSKYLKGNLSGEIGDADCRTYQLVNEVQKHVSYDIPSLQLEYSKKRLYLIQAAVENLTGLQQEEQKRLEVGASTKTNLMALEVARANLEDQEANLANQISLINIPPIDNHQSLHALLVFASAAQHEEQSLLAEQAKKDNWDVSVTVGEGSNPNVGMFSRVPNETFASLQFTYSIGAPKRNRALGSSADHYSRWLDANETGPIKLGQQLMWEVARARDSDAASVKNYDRHQAVIAENLASVEGIDTAVARAFRLNLEVEAITSGIERDSNVVNINLLSRYLEDNFAFAN